MDLLFGKVLTFTFTGLGLFLNSMAIWILVSKQSMQKMFMHLLGFSLVCDNFFILLDFIIACYHELGLSFLVWTLPVFYTLKEVFYLANILCTCALSYERYVHITDKSRNKAQLKIKYHRFMRLRNYVIAILTTSFLLNCPSFFTYTIIHNNDSGQWTLEKTELRKNKWYLIFDKLIKWLLIYLFTFFALTFYNVKIYISVKEKMKSPANLNGNSVDLSSTESKRMSCFSFLGKIKKSDKISLALFLVVAAFLFCNVWYVGEEMLKSFGIDVGRVPNYLTISRFMRTLNACINVLVYSFADEKFKSYLKQNICRLLDLIFCSVVRYQKTITTGQTESTDMSDSKTTNTSQDPRSQLHENDTKI